MNLYKIAKTRVLFFTAALICCFSLTIFAQTSGQISGTVKDPSGLVVPGANVSVINEATGEARTAVTNDGGEYVVTNLNPGDYTVEVSMSGFKQFFKKANVLTSAGRISVNANLETGGINEIVEVFAEMGETVNTTSGEQSRVIDGEQVANLALNGRNFVQLGTLIPGAPLLDFDAISATTNPGQGNLSINGNRPDANNLTVDGGFNLSKANANLIYNNVGIDFIQEVKVLSSNFSAEFGRQGGAAINVTTRSGGNKFNGSLFEFFRNDALDARNFFATDVRKLRFNDFGGGIGGPIIKNKLFFFGGMEFKVIRRSFDPTVATLPTTAELNGDFSFRLRGADGIPGTADDPGLRDPTLTGTCSTTVRTACFPGNRIPIGRITADGRAFADLYRQMIARASYYNDAAVTNNAIFETNGKFDFRQNVLRIDYKINNEHSIFGRYLYDTITDVGSRAVLSAVTNAFDGKTTRRNPSFIFGHNWILRPTLINEMRVSFSRSKTDETPDEFGMRDHYGFTYNQLFNDGLFPNGIPTISVTGFTGITGPNSFLKFRQSDFTVLNNLTRIKGNHNLKTGLLILIPVNKQQGRASAANIPNGTVAFSTTGNIATNSTANSSLADMLLGNFRTYTESSQPPLTTFVSKGVEAYITDQWKVNRRLSLEFGIRYQYLGANYTSENALSIFDPALYDPAQAVTVNTNGTLAAGVGNPYNGMIRVNGNVGNPTPIDPSRVPAGLPRGVYDSPHKFAPRFSFAYAPFDDNKTAIRGGIGFFYNNVRSALTQQIGDNPPFIVSGQYENQSLAAISRSTLVPLGTVITFQNGFTVPKTVNYSLSVQRELWGGILGEIAYVGNFSENLTRQPEINSPSFATLRSYFSVAAASRPALNSIRPYKGYSSILKWRSDARSNYNALQVYLTKRKGQFRFTQSYTFGKALTDASGVTENSEDPENLDYNYGPASFDRRHIAVTTYTYTVGKLFNGKDNTFGKVGNVLVSGWEISGITRFQSGAGFTITGTTLIGTRRADFLGGDLLLPKDQRLQPSTSSTIGVTWLNPAAFAIAPEDRNGNSSVRMVYGPWLQLLDVSLRKRFILTEKLRMQIQGDFFNIFNRANFSTLINLIGTRSQNFTTGEITETVNGNFGLLTASNPARNIQFGLKFTF